MDSLRFSAQPYRKTLAVFAVIGILSLDLPDAKGVNLLANPGFEDDAVMGQEPVPGATGWTTAGNAPSATASAPLDPVRTGVGSLQHVTPGGFSVPVTYQTFTASPGQVWDLSGYMLSKEALPANATNALLKIVFGDGAADLQIPAGNILVG